MKQRYFIYIGIFVLVHWFLLVYDRIINNIPLNLFWISHFVLLIAAIGFILRNNFILTGSLILILIMHGLWILDFVFLLVLGNSPSSYTQYVYRLTPFRKLLTFHHIYLIPLIIWALWKQKKISKHGWVFASIFFAIFSLMSFLFIRREYNINCAHFLCKPLEIVFPFLSIINNFHPILYLVLLNVFMTFFIFYLPNKLLYIVFTKK